MSANHPARGDEPTFGHSLPLLYNLVYCSRASEGVDAAAVDRIIETSRRRNPARGITGLLVFGGGVFFQWLEGPRDNVLELMEQLKTDQRHQSVVPLTAGEEMRERVFPDWDMELVSAEGIRDVLVDALENAREQSHANALRAMLDQLDATPPEDADPA